MPESRAATSSNEALYLNSNELRQGDTLEVNLRLAPGVTPPSVSFNGKSFKLYPSTGSNKTASGAGQSSATTDDAAARGNSDRVSWHALIGVPADLTPATYTLTAGDIVRKIVVKPGGFSVQRLRLPKEKDNFISSPGEEEAVKQAKETATDVRLWHGRFKRPSQARTSTGFGQRRIVNGHLLKDYFHSGLDFAGALGTPVVAAQRGKVILAHNGWKLHGNTVSIDHGQGVVTFYIHLSKIKVKEGDVVEAGQEIGRVGMTGRASGPHLHFSVYVNGDATNPLNWFAREF
jgi:murein DD-endopeptidase MepM/ murein hydrolase activator NlpD